MTKRLLDLDYQERRLQVPWWWRFVYGPNAPQNVVYLILALIGLAALALFVSVFWLGV